MRSWLLEYAATRSAHGDILVFYFSGHGTTIGTGEFAFCCSDARCRPDGDEVLPLSILAFGDVMDTLGAVNVHPVFIIDACYAGASGGPQRTPASELMALMHDDVHRKAGSSYAILCACSERHTAIDEIDGGMFIQTLADLVLAGIPGLKRQGVLRVQDIFPLLQEMCTTKPDLGHPRLYLGPSLPDFQLCRNAAYEQLAYGFAPYMALLVEALWNGGNATEFTTAQIREGAAGWYGNHRKLSLSPWDLLEDGETPKSRRLTERGCAFAKGELAIPRTIRATNSNTGDPNPWEAAPGSPMIKIEDV